MMNSSLDDIVCHAHELPEAEQAAWLDQACGGDGLIRAEADSMLRRMREADAFFEETSPARQPPEEQEGARIGHWKLLQRIGEGGFGTVWMASQEKPVSRRVALKIIKAGMNTREVVARFEQERQALAMMEHPNIARIFDAGSTDSGRPYFVMELVKGLPVTTFCDERRMGIRDRLLLFMEICGAISHAHQKGVIHRDIKPSNVMVTLHGDKAVPKIIDFGIAKATQHRLTDHTLFTRFEHFVGTPVYMSPEQTALSGLDTDTRSDIYALGILLYELITGSAPFDEKTLISAGYEGMRRIIRETDPPRPSQRLSTVAGEERSRVASARQVAPEQVRRLVEPELDWIVMKAIEKDRSRRYETANAFAQDIERFLTDQTVSAIPPSKAYQFRKFARRHRAGLRVAVILGIAAMVSTLLVVRAQRAELDAARQAEADRKQQMNEAEEVAQFLTDMLQSPDPASERGRNITVAEVLDRAAGNLKAGLKDQPDLRTRLQGALGKAYAALGYTDKALALQEPVLEYNLRKFKEGHPATIKAMAALAWTYDYASRREEAVKMQRQVLEWCQKTLRYGHADTVKAMSDLGRTLYFAGESTEGTSLQEQALDISRRYLGVEHPHTLDLMHWLAVAYHSTDREEEARRLDAELLPLRVRINGENHLETIRARGALAAYSDNPIKAQEEVVASSEDVNGPEHPLTLAAMATKFDKMAGAGQYKEALDGVEKLIPVMIRVRTLKNADTLWAMAIRASCLNEVGRKTEAMAKWEEVVRLRTEVLKADHSDTLGARAKLACVYDEVEINRLQDALELREEILPLLEKLGPGYEETINWVRGGLISNYEAAGRQADADRLRGESKGDAGK